ncbi:MAG TPA: TM2 domain-containing protein [Labilithrix sp.]|nr:TM2 domain-containing protein [Labilithrix sp.]
MMNQGAPVPGAPAPGASPSAAPAPAVGAGAPIAGASAPASRLKGTIVGVAPPNAGAAPAPPSNAGEQYQFGSAQGANPLGATFALDTQSPAAVANFGAPDPNAGGMGAPPGPAFGAPPAGGGYGAPPSPDAFGAPAAPPPGMDGGMGAPPAGAGYGAPPQPGYGAPPGAGYGAPPGAQPGFDPMNAGAAAAAAMQPYGGAPMAGPGMPGAMVAGEQKSWMTTLLLALFVGWAGVHRFYTGHTLFGVLQLVTCGGGGIWQLVDIIFILTGKYTDAQGRPLAK